MRFLTLLSVSMALAITACGSGSGGDPTTLCSTVCDDGARLGCSEITALSRSECVAECTASFDTPSGCFDTNVSLARCVVNKGTLSRCEQGNPFYELEIDECQGKVQKALERGCATPL